MQFQWILLILVFICLGCDGKSYTLRIDGGKLDRWIPDGRARVLHSVDAMAENHSYALAASKDVEGEDKTLATYRLTQLGDAKSGWSKILVQEVSGRSRGVEVTQLVFPSFDYPEAKSFRDELKADLQKKFGTQAVKGY